MNHLAVGGFYLEPLNEKLLDMWLNLSATICNDRIVSVMRFNEAFVCNLLYKQYTQSPTSYLTATHLCEKTKMLKSQMNKTLNALEEKGVITRFKSDKDKRMIYISLREDNLNLYRSEHQKVLDLIDALIAKTGEDQVIQAIQSINILTKNFEMLMQERTTHGN